MYIKKLKDCPQFIAGDGSILRELLHADKGEFAFRYSLAHAIVKADLKTIPHKLKTSEVYYIISGSGRMFINDESQDVGPGCAIDIPPGAKQYIENTGDTDLEFICIVDPAWRLEDEEVL
jgi:mannose-6-phosphate isomerase-like protein (cupin superfamily)